MIIIVMVIIIVGVIVIIIVIVIIAILIVVIIMIARLPYIRSHLLTKIGHSQILRIKYIKVPYVMEHIKTMVSRINNIIPTIVDCPAEGLSPFAFSRRQC